ncbi:MAG: hypothetical protein LBU14_05025 [Candidatus Peribacteria bacterium]|jgi:Tfp pilus assembly protein PilO|nr:hypothetical protein [Candidatus Peribacteria bacterium]
MKHKIIVFIVIIVALVALGYAFYKLYERKESKKLDNDIKIDIMQRDEQKSENAPIENITSAE